MGSLNVEIGDVVLENPSRDASYSSPPIQKEILHILANDVRKKIRTEIGEAKYCILVDEAKDISNKEQMAIVLRFVDADGFLKERVFYIVHVSDTTGSTLKKEIFDVLTRWGLHIHDLRGQGYDGASNMRGAWNGLQALFLRDCPYAYYVHYHFDVFNEAINLQLQELDDRFNDETVELLRLSSSLEPKDKFKSFNAGQICRLAEKFYLDDFNKQEMHYLKSQLDHYEVDVLNHAKFQNMTTISELCRGLVEINKVQSYHLIDKLIQLIMTLPVSTATTERSFSAIKHVKSA